MATTKRSRPGLTSGLIVVVALLASGCGRHPQVASDNRELVAALATAVSARNPEWLEANARKIAERRGGGRLSAAEDRAFASILDKARAGDWKAAEDEVYGLRDAQEPTAEDVETFAANRSFPPREPLETTKTMRSRPPSGTGPDP